MYDTNRGEMKKGRTILKPAAASPSPGNPVYCQLGMMRMYQGKYQKENFH